MSILKPPRLRKGELIGIVAPASPVEDESRIDRGVRYLEKLGYDVVVGRHVTRVRGYLAGTDRERAEDLHTMFRDRRVKAIIALRGGYGSPRLLSHLDYRLIARHPKVFAGSSDLTALQLALWKQCRMVTFHGPMLAPDFAGPIDGYAEEMFWRLVTSNRKAGALPLPKGTQPKSLRRGKTAGRLLGGNLSILVTLPGTPYQPDFRRSAFFIEDIGEEPYRIDRMLTHLRNAGVLSHVSAILCGQFTDCEPKNRSHPSLSLAEVLADGARSVNVPFITNLPFGHVTSKMTLPVGVRVAVDAGKGAVELLEAAVR